MKKEQVISIGEQSGFDKVAAQAGGFELFWDQTHLTKELMNFAKLVEQATLERAAKKFRENAELCADWMEHTKSMYLDGADVLDALKDSHD